MANVGYATLQIIPSTRGFAGALNGATGPAAGAAGQNAGRAMGGGILGSLKGLAGPLAAAFGGAALIGGLTDSIALASDFSETLNKSNVIFGTSAAEITKWSENSVSSLGIAQGEALATAAQFGDMFKQMGIGAPKVAGMSKDFLKLSADIGSFQNAETGDVTSAFQSALRGEYESIQRFLPALKGARVEQEALRLSGKSNAKQLTQSEKAQALYALAIKDGASANNDYAETHGGLAGQQKELAANITNLKTKIGTGLLPIMTSITGFINAKLFPAFGKVAPVFTKIGSTISGVFAGFSGGGGAGAFTTVMNAVRSGIAFVMPYIQQLKTMAVPVFNQFKATIATVMADAGPIIRALGAVFQFVFPLIFAQVKFYIGAVLNVVRGTLGVIQGVVKVFSGILTGDWGKVWDGVKNIVSGAFNIIKGLFSIFLLGRILGIAKAFLNFLKPLFGAGLRAAGGAVSAGLRAILNFFRAAPQMYVRALANLAGLLGNVIKVAFRVMLSGARSGGSMLMGFLRGIPGQIGALFTALPGTLTRIGGDLMRGLASGISGMAGSVIASIKRNVTDALPDFVKKALGIHSPSRVFMGFGKNISQGLAIGIDKGAPKVLRAMNNVTALADMDAATAGSYGMGAQGGSPLVGALTLQSGGSVRDDLAEVDFYLRRVQRGGIRA